METRITRKVDTYLAEFKREMKEWFEINSSDISGKHTKSDFLKFIFDYNAINLSKEDFTKRKRVKNTVPTNLRCCAKRANGEQCTRHKKEEYDFCGTHIKGTPYGKMDCTVDEPILAKKRDVWVQDIKGIQYFIDNSGNVYNHNEVLANKVNPAIIAKYIKKNDIYSIPAFNI
jgi:hypothetical protein